MMNHPFKFYGHEGQYVIVYYITYKHMDNVFNSFDNLVDAMDYMDRLDLWDDYYIHYIDDSGDARGWDV